MMTEFTSASEGPLAVAALVGWIGTYALHLTLLLLGTGIVLRVARVRSALARDLVWKAALSAALFSASLTLTAPVTDSTASAPGHHGAAPVHDGRRPTLAPADPELLPPAGCSSIGYLLSPSRSDRSMVGEAAITGRSPSDSATCSE